MILYATTGLHHEDPGFRTRHPAKLGPTYRTKLRFSRNPERILSLMRDIMPAFYRLRGGCENSAVEAKEGAATGPLRSMQQDTFLGKAKKRHMSPPVPTSDAVVGGPDMDETGIRAGRRGSDDEKKCGMDSSGKKWVPSILLHPRPRKAMSMFFE